MTVSADDENKSLFLRPGNFGAKSLIAQPISVAERRAGDGVGRIPCYLPVNKEIPALAGRVAAVHPHELRGRGSSGDVKAVNPVLGNDCGRLQPLRRAAVELDDGAMKEGPGG
jgi:hypothetical protein